MNFRIFLHALFGCCLLASCGMEPRDYAGQVQTPAKTEDRLLILCEGLWGQDNSCLSYIDCGTQTDKWFQKMNPGMHLGDTGNDIIMVNDTLIAISVNWSNLIQYIYPDGRAITATENIPNNRRLATDGQFLYCTSYANHGYVAKIDLVTKQIVDTCRTGYEPEGIACYDGRLYIANTGGYAFQDPSHGYESTVSVVDAQTMKELKRIDTGCINLMGDMSQSGRFVCISSAGDNYDVAPRTVVLDMATDEFRVFDFAATYNCAYGNRFYVIGAAFSYNTQDYVYSEHTISVPSLDVSDGLGDYNAAVSVIRQLQTPYGIYISPYSGHLYVTDARQNVLNGYLYEFGTDGRQLNRWMLKGLNPGHFLALP